MSTLSPKNASTPAHPVPGSFYHGLSKREFAALTILAGLASRQDGYTLPRVDDAVYLADKLLVALEVL